MRLLLLGATLALLPLSGQGDAQIEQSDKITAPQILVGTRCPYSAEALQTGASGEVTIGVHITDAGQVSKVDVSQSSGTSTLDELAVMCGEKWRFKPATMNGKPVASLSQYKVRIVTPPEFADAQVVNISPSNRQAPLAVDSPPASHDKQSPASLILPVLMGSEHCGYKRRILAGTRLPATWTKLSFKIEMDGSVTDISAIDSSGSRVTDDAAVKCISSWHFIPAKQDGSPVEVQVTRVMHFQ